MRIRPGGAADLSRLQEVERAAGELFRDVGMPEVADDDPPSIAELEGHLSEDGILVAEVDGEVAGYAVVSAVDGQTFLDQLSVDPAFGRRGIGGALVEAVCLLAAGRDHAFVTLTTFSGVAWNEPFYASRGFELVPLDRLGPELATARAEETARGLDPSRRVVMRRLVG